MTEADKEALAAMPDGWFKPTDLYINRPAYRCERLHKDNLLDWKVSGEYPHMSSEYRKISKSGDAQEEAKP
ncbi:hypothetical protein [Serratia fonticola]|uniref:hypothetical protein n=1 Tax=Serratia fonticola TaxID=47917 RepID=UPI0021BADDF1|nr:hypothetical protein [Serratia fonticola]